ncbi:MAG: sugar transferase [Bacteroidales bacterium]|nr:sugar transferase [Bacteroidales bacterium]
MDTKRRQRAKYIASDLLSAALAWTALFSFRKLALEEAGWDGLSSVVADSNYWLGLVVVPLGWLALYVIMGSYRDVLRRSRVKELVETLVATLIGSVVLFFVLIIDDEVPRLVDYYRSFLFLLAVHFTLTYLPRLAITSQTVRRVHSRLLGFPAIMIGGGNRAMQTYLDLENQETYSGEQFVGYVDIDTTGRPSPLAKVMPRLGTMDDLPALVTRLGVEEVILAVEESQRHMIWQLLPAVNRCGELIIKLTPDARDIIVGSVRQESIFHSPLITLDTRLMPEWQYSVKRIADVVLSALALVVLSPVFLITAAIVKLSSPGPVFYAQERVGYRGRPFKMHKFRSMYVDAEKAGPALSKDDDPRITPFGRFMRKVRLDEIPQFYNVLRGTMSIVGPRPERQFYIDQIVQRAPEYLLLQRIKPGITSWGQVKYGYASNVDEMVERLRYDLLYLDNMSLMTDIKILCYTVLIILQGRGK